MNDLPWISIGLTIVVQFLILTGARSKQVELKPEHLKALTVVHLVVLEILFLIWSNEGFGGPHGDASLPWAMKVLGFSPTLALVGLIDFGLSTKSWNKFMEWGSVLFSAAIMFANFVFVASIGI